MKEEVKIILNGLKFAIENEDCDCILSPETAKSLLDYITKLQEENERLHKSLGEQRHFYLGEIQRYEHYCKTTGIDELIGENERLHNIIKEVREYIEENLFKDDNDCGCWWYGFDYYKEAKKELLEILDKENKE